MIRLDDKLDKYKRIQKYYGNVKNVFRKLQKITLNFKMPSYFMLRVVKCYV